MENKLTEAAKLYLNEWPLLEEARRDLNSALDELWAEIWSKAKPQIDPLLDYTGKSVGRWKGNDADHGSQYMVTELKKLPVNLQIHYYDLRQSKLQRHVRLTYYCAQTGRAELRRNTDWMNRLNELCEANQVPPFNPKESWMAVKEIPVNLEDLEASANEIANELVLGFQVIAEFEQWLIELGVSK